MATMKLCYLNAVERIGIFMHTVDLMFLGLAVVVAYRLYTILGQKKGPDDIKKTNPLKDSWAQPAVTPEKKAEEPLGPLVTALKQIEHSDKHFTQERFLNGAEKAFEMILSSFMKGDKEALKDLVGEKLLKQFSTVIDQREKAGQRAELAFLRLAAIKIEDISIKNHKALIKVLFQSEQTQLLRNDKNEVLEGDPDHIDQIDEVWTFERPLEAKTPNWVLVETTSA
jgi:predicted lipid-binding transport protein (Tim44 family)